MALSLQTPFLPTIPKRSSSSSSSSSSNFTTTKFPFLPSDLGRGGGSGPWLCRKKDGVHPEFYQDAKVYCNGKLVMTTGGTQKEYRVDVWSGNHPFYLGNRSALVLEDDQVEKFRRKYGQLSKMMEIPDLKHGEIVLPQRKKTQTAKGKGKK